MTQKIYGPLGHSITGAGPEDGWMHPARTGHPAADAGRIATTPDKGCNLAPRCLECPFPACKHDGGSNTPRKRNMQEKDAKADTLVNSQGFTAAQAATIIGVTPRTVHRMVARVRTRTKSAS